jgi:hypothetical protein
MPRLVGCVSPPGGDFFMPTKNKEAATPPDLEEHGSDFVATSKSLQCQRACASPL